MTLHIVVDGMFGSCGKGHLAAQLADRSRRPLVIRTGGPNAGHTVLGRDGTAYKLRCLPTAAVSNPSATLALAAGSVVDPIVLADEIKLVAESANPLLNITIDPAATILTPLHVAAENDPHPDGLGAILGGWSTQKGIGAARMDRIARRAKTARDWNWSGLSDVIEVRSVEPLVRDWTYRYRDVIIETAQGYGLGLHTDYYPKTTSADCRAIDALADVGYSPWGAGVLPRVWIALRPHPIRVAGDSGPLKGETSWEALELEAERTTVTNKVRRVGAWDQDLVAAAVRANGGPADNVGAVLMMADQIQPNVAGLTRTHQFPEDYDTLVDYIDRIEAAGAHTWAVGTGPNTMAFFQGGGV